MKFFFNSSESKEAIIAKKELIKKYGQNNAEKADIIVPLGGDGFLLKSLHDYKELNKPFYGINYGSIGFLMNNINKENLTNIIDKSQKITLKSLTMKTTNINNENFESIAFNEVSIMRQSHQASKIQIMINGIERMKE
jgi:NAD+ kinase